MPDAPCPSNHWNDGTDRCADCGADLNPVGHRYILTVAMRYEVSTETQEHARALGETLRRELEAIHVGAFQVALEGVAFAPVGSIGDTSDRDYDWTNG